MRIGLPSTSMRSVRGSARTPISVTTLPLTLTRPAAIISSAARREATPALASTFWGRSPTGPSPLPPALILPRPPAWRARRPTAAPSLPRSAGRPHPRRAAVLVYYHGDVDALLLHLRQQLVRAERLRHLQDLAHQRLHAKGAVRVRRLRPAGYSYLTGHREKDVLYVQHPDYVVQVA